MAIFAYSIVAAGSCRSSIMPASGPERPDVRENGGDGAMQTVKDDEVKLYADFDNRQRVQSIGQKRQPGKTILVIDFSAYADDGSLEERKRVARALHDTCIDTGFFYLAHHGISEAEIALAHDWGRLFFELP